jgi:hypothetical protein
VSGGGSGSGAGSREQPPTRPAPRGARRTEEGQRRAAGLLLPRVGQRRDHVAARLGLPPGVDDGALAVADDIVVPWTGRGGGGVGGGVGVSVGTLPRRGCHEGRGLNKGGARRRRPRAPPRRGVSPPHAPAPRLGVDGLADGAEDAQGVALVLLHKQLARAHEAADGGGRGVELLHLFPGPGEGWGGERERGAKASAAGSRGARASALELSPGPLQQRPSAAEGPSCSPPQAPGPRPPPPAHLVLVHHLPAAVSGRVGGHALEHDLARAHQQGAVGEVGVARDPAAVGGAPGGVCVGGRRGEKAGGGRRETTAGLL